MSEEFEQIKSAFNAYVADPKPFFPGDLGAALGILDWMCHGKTGRHRLQLLLTGCKSVTEMTEGHKWAIVKFVMPNKVEGKWVSMFPEHLKSRIDIILAEGENGRTE